MAGEPGEMLSVDAGLNEQVTPVGATGQSSASGPEYPVALAVKLAGLLLGLPGTAETVLGEGAPSVTLPTFRVTICE